jgi:hypothetical protein
MVDSNSQNNDTKNKTTVIKTVRITRPKRIIRTPKIRSTEIEPATSATASSPAQLLIPESKTVPTIPSKPETNPDNAPLPANQLLWKSATRAHTHTSKNPIGILDRIFDPALQYKVFLVFLSIWGAAIVLFYVSTSFVIILPDPFNLVVLGFFLAATSLSGIYTFGLGVQHLRHTQQRAEDDYY